MFLVLWHAVRLCLGSALSVVDFFPLIFIVIGHVVIRACIDGLQQDACPICRHPAERSTQVYKLCFQAEDQPAPPQAYIEKYALLLSSARCVLILLIACRYIQDFFYQYEELKGVRERLQDEGKYKTQLIANQEERLQRYLAKTESHMTAAKRSQASLDKLNAQWNELSSERLSPVSTAHFALSVPSDAVSHIRLSEDRSKFGFGDVATQHARSSCRRRSSRTCRLLLSRQRTRPSLASRHSHPFNVHSLI